MSFLFNLICYISIYHFQCLVWLLIEYNILFWFQVSYLRKVWNAAMPEIFEILKPCENWVITIHKWCLICNGSAYGLREAHLAVWATVMGRVLWGNDISHRSDRYFRESKTYTKRNIMIDELGILGKCSFFFFLRKMQSV